MSTPSHARRREAELLARQGKFEDARRVYDEMTKATPEDEARWVVARALCDYYAGRYDEAIVSVGRGLRTRWPAAARSAYLHSIRALCYAANGRTDLAHADIRSAREGLDAAEGALAAEARCVLFRAEGNVGLAEGNFALAAISFRRELDGLSTDETWARSIASYNLAEARIENGELALGLELLEEARWLKESIEDLWGLAYLHRTLARARLALGSVVEAVVECRRGLFYARRVREPKIVSGLEVELCRVATLRGDFHLAELAWKSALEHARACGAFLELCRATLALAHTDLLRGDTAAANGRASWAKQTADRRGFDQEAHRASLLCALASHRAEGARFDELHRELSAVRSPSDRLEFRVLALWWQTKRTGRTNLSARESLLEETRSVGAARLEALCLACVAPDAHAELDEAEATLWLLSCEPEAQSVADYHAGARR